MDNLERSLLRWVGAGLVEPEHAERIREWERSQLPPDDDFGIGMDPGPEGWVSSDFAEDEFYEFTPVEPPAPTSDRSAVALEAAAYFGTTLVLVALGVIIGRDWQRLEPLAHVGILLAAAAVTLIGGLGLNPTRSPSFRRLGSVLWGLSVIFLTAAVVDASIEIAEFDERTVPLVGSIAAAVYSFVLWLRRKSDFLQLLLLGSLNAIWWSVLILPEHIPAPMWFGCATAALGVMWMLLAWPGLIKPERSAWVLGSGSTLLGIQAIALSDHRLSVMIGLAASVLVIVLGIVLPRMVVLVIGSIGAFAFVYQGVLLWFGNSVEVNLAMLAVGILLVAGVIIRFLMRGK